LKLSFQAGNKIGGR